MEFKNEEKVLLSKVIKKSNIYHDYAKILKKEYDNLDNLDIWNLWYSLDNQNIVKKEIMEKNFQIRKEGYITHYRVLWYYNLLDYK